MPSVKFYPSGKGPYFNIVIKFSHDCQSFFNRSAITKQTKKWDKKGKNGPESITGNSPEDIEFRNELKTIKHELEISIPKKLREANPGNTPTLEDIQKEFYISRGIPLPKNIRGARPEQKKKEAKLETLVCYLKDFAKLKGKTYKKSTINKYNLIADNIAAYCKLLDRTNNITDINNIWLERYCTEFLLEDKVKGGLEYENDTVVTELKKIHAIIEHYELPNRITIKKICSSWRLSGNNKETDAIHLEIREVGKIYRFDCREYGVLNKKWLMARDLYVFCCYAPLRHNELFQLDKAHSVKSIINKDGNLLKTIGYVADKTGQYNQVPLNKVCLEIIERWKDEQIIIKRNTDEGVAVNLNALLPYMSDNNCNKHLHDMLRHIGLQDMKEKYKTSKDLDTKEQIGFWERILRVRYIGKRRKEEWIPKWEKITFHSSRHTCACYLLDQGVSISFVQGLLGHKSQATTERWYARIKKARQNSSVLEITDSAHTMEAMKEINLKNKPFIK